MRLRPALAEHKAPLTLLEHQLDERRTDERQFQRDMRTALARGMQAIGGSRTQLVHKQDRKWR